MAQHFKAPLRTRRTPDEPHAEPLRRVSRPSDREVPEGLVVEDRGDAEGEGALARAHLPDALEVPQLRDQRALATHLSRRSGAGTLGVGPLLRRALRNLFSP